MFSKARRPFLAAVVIASCVVIASAAYAAGASATVTYYACLKGGALTKVGTTSPVGCATGSTIISWNSEGLPGPAGAPGATGPTGPTGPTSIEERPASINDVTSTVKSISTGGGQCYAPDAVPKPLLGDNLDCYFDLAPGQTITTYKIHFVYRPTMSLGTGDIRIDAGNCQNFNPQLLYLRNIIYTSGMPAFSYTNQTNAPQCYVMSLYAGFSGIATYHIQ